MATVHKFCGASAIEQKRIDDQTLAAFADNRLRYSNVGDDLTGQIKFMFGQHLRQRRPVAMPCSILQLHRQAQLRPRKGQAVPWPFLQYADVGSGDDYTHRVYEGARLCPYAHIAFRSSVWACWP